LSHVHVAPHDPAALIAALAQPDVHLVTMTITEKGYRPLSDTPEALAEPDIAHDLDHPDQPRTALGFLTAALARRRAAGLAPFTVISCDNLGHNGDKTRAGILALAGARDRDLAAWIADQGAFPCTMVDRIVPATTEGDIAALAQTLGVEDRGMVKTEPFLQWVIEDRFCGPRPDFAAHGVQLTAAVAPWEQAKLRLLNGSHTALAYLGALAGHQFVADAMAAPGYRGFVWTLMDEAQSTLTPPPELDLSAYRAALVARFDNPALAHRTVQIAMDGSQKLPQRLLETIRVRLKRGQPFPALALAVAGWMRWQRGVDEQGTAFVVDDPLASQTAALLEGKSDPDAMVAALLRLTAVFGADLPADPRFGAAVSAALGQLLTAGAARTVAGLSAQEGPP
jgi:fructuronate reductase